jgi:hypothetical protein
MGKLSRARRVWAPKSASLGTSTSPIESRSTRCGVSCWVMAPPIEARRFRSILCSKRPPRFTTGREAVNRGLLMRGAAFETARTPPVPRLPVQELSPGVQPAHHPSARRARAHGHDGYDRQPRRGGGGGQDPPRLPRTALAPGPATPTPRRPSRPAPRASRVQRERGRTRRTAPRSRTEKRLPKPQPRWPPTRARTRRPARGRAPR